MPPVHVWRAGGPIEYPRQNKQQVGQAVQILACMAAHGRRRRQSMQIAFRAAAYRAGHVGLGRGTTAAGENELGQRRQRVIVVRNARVQRRHGRLLQQGLPGQAELAAEIEQIVLHERQIGIDVGRATLGAQYAQVTIEFVNRAQGDDTRVGFGQPRAVGQAGATVIAGTGDDTGETISDDRLANYLPARACSSSLLTICSDSP